MKKVTEKMSNFAERKLLISKIKENGLREIREREIVLKNAIIDLNLTIEADYERFNDVVVELTELGYLKDYLSRSSMCDINVMWDDNVEYIIPTRTLATWLDKGVLAKYMSYIHTEIKPGPLNDRSFGYNSRFTANKK